MAVVRLIAGLVLIAGLPVGMPVALADTTAECGRFFLKRDPGTGRTECVNKKKGGSRSNAVRAIRRQQRAVQGLVNRAQKLLSGVDVSDEQRRRARELITEARQRFEQLMRRTSELRQEQESFSLDVQNSAKQRTRAQIELSRSLEQQQRALVRQIIAQQRQLQQSFRARRSPARALPLAQAR